METCLPSGEFWLVSATQLRKYAHQNWESSFPQLGEKKTPQIQPKDLQLLQKAWRRVLHQVSPRVFRPRVGGMRLMTGGDAEGP